ncbi:unnamed protein product, partial [Ectocarpus sp. 8 AP-2014]
DAEKCSPPDATEMENIVEVKKTRAEETQAGDEEPSETGKKTATADGSALSTATSVDASASRVFRNQPHRPTCNASRGGNRHAGCNCRALHQRFPKIPI